MENETNQKNSTMTVAIVVILVAIVAFVVYTIARKNSETELMVVEEEKTAMEEELDKTQGDMKKETEKTAKETTMEKDPTVKEFVVKGLNFTFDVAEIKVKKGDTVRIVFKNTEGFHDWVIDEFNAKTKQINADEEETIEFIADQTGTFEYYCSVGKHREMGMVGNLIVE